MSGFRRSGHIYACKLHVFTQTVGINSNNLCSHVVCISPMDQAASFNIDERLMIEVMDH